MDQPGVLVSPEPDTGHRTLPDPGAAWRWLGWFGLLLAVMGWGDLLLAWFPSHLGNAQWEFGTVVTIFSGLPVVTIGYAALIARALALGSRRLAMVMAIVLSLTALLLLGGFVLFLLDVPVAIRAVGAGPASLGISKAIAKTSMLGAGFVIAYLAGSTALFRRLRRRS